MIPPGDSQSGCNDGAANPSIRKMYMSGMCLGAETAYKNTAPVSAQLSSVCKMKVPKGIISRTAPVFLKLSFPVPVPDQQHPCAPTNSNEKEKVEKKKQ
jgi:hypothetical protein